MYVAQTVHSTTLFCEGSVCLCSELGVNILLHFKKHHYSEPGGIPLPIDAFHCRSNHSHHEEMTVCKENPIFRLSIFNMNSVFSVS